MCPGRRRQLAPDSPLAQREPHQPSPRAKVKHGREVRVASHTLDPTGQVEDHAGPVAGDRTGHEVL